MIHATNNRRPRRRGSASARRGALMVVALAILAVVTMLALAAVRSLAVAARAQRQQAWRAQALWLAEAGVERAAARLRGEPNYRGETWPVAAAELSGADVGEVRIEVQPAATEGRWRLNVSATFPADPQHKATVTKTVFIDQQRS